MEGKLRFLLNRVVGTAMDVVFQRFFPINHHAVGDACNLTFQPERRLSAVTIVSGAAGIHAPGAQQFIYLRKMLGGTGFIYGIGVSAMLADHRETGDVAGAVRDINHIAYGYATFLFR